MAAAAAAAAAAATACFGKQGSKLLPPALLSPCSFMLCIVDIVTGQPILLGA